MKAETIGVSGLRFEVWGLRWRVILPWPPKYYAGVPDRALESDLDTAGPSKSLRFTDEVRKRMTGNESWCHFLSKDVDASLDADQRSLS